jgi:hypothetical protein
MDRRTFLGGASAVGLGALAGCMSAIGTVAPPETPDELLDEGGWEQADQSEETILDRSYGPVDVTAKSTTVTYTDTALSASLREKTLDRIDATLAIFAASHINFSPDLNNLPAAVGRKEVLNRTETQAKAQFEQQMRDQGLENVEQQGEAEFTTDSGKSPGVTQFTAEYPVGSIQYDTGEETFTLDVGSLDVAGDLAVWNEGDYVVVAGGAYPNQNFAETTEKDLSEAITVTLDVDLGLTPDAYREEARELMAATR